MRLLRRRRCRCGHGVIDHSWMLPGGCHRGLFTAYPCLCLGWSEQP